MRVSPIDERTSAVLDVMRWVAALVVVLTHVNDQVFLSMAETPEESRTLALMAWKLISASGNEAVIVFFVISGYLVGGAALAEFLRDGDIKLSNYMLRRCARLYTVLIPALVIGANIGTTITAHLVAFDIVQFAFVLAILGFGLMSFSKKGQIKQVSQRFSLITKKPPVA
mgnify:CR=1 FL=1